MTIQLVPAVLHAGLLSSIILADGAALVETSADGHVYTDERTIATLTRRFDTMVRDTTDRAGVTLTVTPAAWRRLTASIEK